MHWRVSISEARTFKRAIHKKLPHADPGMVRTARASPKNGILIMRCWTADEECPYFLEGRPEVPKGAGA